MRLIAILLLAVALAVAGCGENEETAATPTPSPAATEAMVEEPMEKAKPGTEIVLADSEFGDMLYDADRQAIYVFELDREDETRCYDECAEAWPPVFTKGEPVAGDGVDEALLGTIERRDGRTQVTYDGRPLYYYAHEEPGEVKCHNINLNGGLWWVVGADGKPLS